MLVIEGAGVAQNYAESVRQIREIGARQDSRAGEVLVAPHPVMTVMTDPRQRVLLDPGRGANPFFHLYEAIWMLAGERDATKLDMFVSDFSERFAEEDGNQWGAYGWRWRNHFEMDQLESVISLLSKNHLDRRCVIQMWDPDEDLERDVADVPCNTQIYPRVRTQEDSLVLDLTVCCRSNDIIWGAMGSNIVHFSILLEYMACRIGVGLGRLYQLSNNWHAYTDTLNRVGTPLAGVEQMYPDGDPQPMFNDPEEADGDIALAMTDNWLDGDYAGDFMQRTFRQMMRAHAAYKIGMHDEAMSLADRVACPMWRQAAGNWLEARA